MQQQLIKYLCDSFYEEKYLYSDIDQKVLRYLRLNKVQFDPFFYDESLSQEKNPVLRLSIWRDLLKHTLLLTIKESYGEEKEDLKKAWYSLSSNNSFKEFQLEQAYTTLIAQLLGISYQSSSQIIQLENGFTPIESASHWPIMNTPISEWHAELGTLWVLIGKMLNEPKYFKYALKLAQWQTKGLDFNYHPQKGFLSSHFLSHYANAHLRDGILFHAVALANSEPKMAYFAKKQFSYLLEVEKKDFQDCSIDALLLLQWIGSLFSGELTPEKPQIEEVIQDPDLAIVGYRSSKLNILASALGTNMGLGSLKASDLEIPAFGPQIQLLGEGQYFGAFGQNPLKRDQQETFKVDTGEKEFNIKGVLGLPEAKAGEPFDKTWQYPKNWMEYNCFFENNVLNIQVAPYRIQSKLYFVFYVIAKKCLVGGEDKILPHSLNQYQGDADSVSFIGENGLIILDAMHPKSELQIIPLEGHRSFWGAQYLIAYHLNNKYSNFGWKISIKDF